MAVLHSDPQSEKYIVAFVTPLVTGLKDSQHDSNIHLTEADKVEGWGEIFDNDTYATIEDVPSAQAGQDFVGWVRMLDGETIPRDEMSEWLRDTIQTIRKTGPAGNVVEIGTGSGMILFSLKDELTHYTGLEPASKALRFVLRAATNDPALANKVDMRLGTASDLLATRAVNPDLFVINSVAQYFPSGDYLAHTIRDAISLACGRPSRMFLGDIRSLALSDEFFATWAVHQLRREGQVAFTSREVRQRSRHLRENHTELLVHPSFFFDLQRKYPNEISHVEVLPKRMKGTNELSQFRYQVVLWFYQKNLDITNVDASLWIDYSERSWSVEDVKRELGNLNGGNILAIKNITNSKIEWEGRLLDSLSGPSEEGWLDHIPLDSARALSPYDLDILAKDAGFRVEISWARQEHGHGRLDAIFFRPRSGRQTLFEFPSPLPSTRPTTNSPAINALRSSVDPADIKEFVRAKLPSYMVPSQIQIISDFPVTANGKVDRRALINQLPSDGTTPREKDTYIPPRTPTEQAVVSVFGDVLGSRHLSAGARYDTLAIK